MNVFLPAAKVEEFRHVSSRLGESSAISFFASLVNILPDGSKLLPGVLFSMLWIESCVSKTFVVVKEQGIVSVVLFCGIDKSSLHINPEPSVVAGFIGIDGASLG